MTVIDALFGTGLFFWVMAGLIGLFADPLSEFPQLLSWLFFILGAIAFFCAIWAGVFI